MIADKGSKPALVIIVPCYNEEEVIPETAEKLFRKISLLVSAGLISEKSTVLFVDDGSQDNTWNFIEKYHSDNPLVFNGLKIPENSGQQNAILCGLLAVRDYADITISIDADLQDDIDVIGKMIESYLSGAEIVLGVRSSREGDGLLKRITAFIFYRLIRLLGGSIIENHGDFRLMGRKALDALTALTAEAEYNKKNLFLHGMINRLRCRTAIVYYSRKKRLAGKSKYSLQKMLAQAFEGIKETLPWRKYNRNAGESK